MIPPGAQGFLAAPQGRVIRLSGVADTGEAAADSRLIRATLRKAWPGVGFQMESALWADPIQLPSSATARTRADPARVAGRDQRPGDADRRDMAWPAAPRRSGARGAAGRRGQPGAPVVGSVLTGAPVSGRPLTSLCRSLACSRPKDPASPYWTLDLLPVSGISVQGYTIGTAGNFRTVSGNRVSYGPAVVNPAAFGGALAAGQASWMALPQAPAMARANIAALTTSTNEAFSQLTQLLPEGLQVTSGLPQLLGGIASTIVLARSLFAIAALELLLVAGAALVLAARLLASLREEESALLRARGATSWQVVRPVLAEAVVLGAAAALAGVLAGTRLAGPLAGLGNLTLEGNAAAFPRWPGCRPSSCWCCAPR